MNYGHFSEDGKKFVVTSPDAPRPFDVMLFNDVCYANVHHTGIGCFDYQYPGEEGIQLFTGVGRICDYDIFGKEHLYSRIIYVRDNETGKFWTVNWEPVCADVQEFSCTHDLGYTTIVNVTEDVKATLIISIPPGKDAVEMWQLKLEDIHGRARDLSVFPYFQLQFKYKWGFDSYGDMIYRTTSFDKENNMFLAEKHPYVKPHNNLTAFFTSSYPVSHYDGSRRLFMGQYGSVANPVCVKSGACTDSDGSAEDTVCVLQWDIKLNGNVQDIQFILGAGDSKERCIELKKTYLHNIPAYTALAQLYRQGDLEKTVIKTGDEHLNRLLNNWTKLACMYGATWCRWGYNGYRDIVQHGLGVVNVNPKRTKAILQEALSYQHDFGMAVRGWNPIDDRPYSDSALWSAYTLAAYIKETGDTKFLYQEIPFLNNPEVKDTVLGHVIRALDFLENNKGIHDLLLIKFGDWNDSLTGAGKEGRGESVWLSMAYAYALSQIAELCRFVGEDEKAANLQARSEAMTEAIRNNAWEGDRFVRCFDDNGGKIGSATNKYAKLFLETQSFALMTGIASPERREIILESLKRESYTPLGYLLLSPAYQEFDDRVGRLSAMEPGIAENGTIYTHPNMWLVLGMLRSGKPNEAYELFRRVAPGYYEEDNYELKKNALPFQFANCFFGPEHRNNAYQMEYSWITGSVAWVRLTIEEWMLGVRPEYDGLHVEPCLPDNFGTYKVERIWRQAKYNITVQQGENKGIVADGVAIEGNVLPAYEDGLNHEIIVTI